MSSQPSFTSSEGNSNLPNQSIVLPPVPSSKLVIPSFPHDDKENNNQVNRNVLNRSDAAKNETQKPKRSIHLSESSAKRQRNINISSLRSSTSKDTARDVSSIRARIRESSFSTSTSNGSSSSSSESKDHVHKITLTGLRRNNNISGTSTRNRILRYGETVESLFCLFDTYCPEDHRSLCHDIVNGLKMDDVEAWKIALEYASDKFKKGDNGQNLIRLHRRATSRLINSRISTDVTSTHLLSIYLSYARAQSLFTSNSDARQTYQYILNKRIGEYDAALYVDIADFEMKEGNLDSAVQSLQRGLNKNARPKNMLQAKLRALKEDSKNEMVNQSMNEEVEEKKNKKNNDTGGDQPSGRMFIPPLPTSLPSISNKKSSSSSQYLSTSNKVISLDQSKNESFTLETPRSYAYPENDKKILFSIDQKKAPSGSIEREGKIPGANDENTSNTKVSISDGDLNDSMMSGSFELDIVPKTTSVMNPTNQPNETSSSNTSMNKINMDKDLKSSSVLMRGGNFSKKARADIASLDTDGEDSSDITPKQGIKSSTKTASKVTFSSLSGPQHSQLPRNRISGLLSKNKQSLLSRNKRTGMLGGAQRLDRKNAASSSIDSDDSDMDATGPGKKCKDKKKRTDQFSKPVPKITRTDLSYMLNWDPEKFRKPTSSPSSGSALEPEGKNRNIGLTMEKIEEESPTDGVSTSGGESGGNGGSIHTNASITMSSSDKSMDTGLSKIESESGQIVHASPEDDKNKLNETATSFHSPQESAMIAKANMEFLPLVSEDNMVSVNSIPYAKLGVIGKGGSCKVYRALSKDCAVLAIKKVKLDGMDPKAISGYANEIALLKKLRGNPAIIQMYDSEVDLERKSIFLVMELGEVDLNHVLQQQAKLQKANEGSSGRFKPTLNMNFIRLTWHQMLNAVHCIHEERIIHSDLKPANFLFVRGALKLIDFGIAKAIQSEDTTNIYRDSQIGTLNYMSPEAILDTGSGGDKARMRLGRASDIWSLGCILYQMVYGRTPFAELHMIQKLQAIVNPKHEIKYPKISEEAAIDAIRLCLQRDNSKRPPIVGKNGLLNEHWFLHSSSRPQSSI